MTLLPPITNPEKILCIGLNYLPHILETGRAKPEKPTIFTRYPDSVVGHGSPLVCPVASDRFDYEGELAVIIGKPGRHIAEADAWDHIAGYSCFNDGSIRDFQSHTTQFWPGKNFEASGGFGPWIVTPDEVGDITAQSLTTRVNGNVEQHTPISDMAISIPRAHRLCLDRDDAETRRRDRHGHARRCGQPPRTAAFHHARKRRRRGDQRGRHPVERCGGRKGLGRG